MRQIPSLAMNISDFYMISIQGDTGGTISITGPAYQADQKPTFAGLKIQTQAGWKQADIYGVVVGPLQLSPSLSGGRLHIPPASADALDGKIQLAGLVDLAPGQTAYASPAQLVMMDNLHITPEVAKQILARFIPLFADAVEIEGLISLNLSAMQRAIRTLPWVMT